MSNEWYTPRKYVKAAEAVMGGPIDLDPASCEQANQIVKATRYYTKEQNGLLQDWTCCSMWLNPPYNGTDDCQYPQPTWSRRLIHEYRYGRVKQAILLISTATKQKWFHELLDYPMCLMLERIFFHRPGKSPEELRHGNTVVYFGPNEARFVKVFSKFGRIMKAIDTLPERPHNLELWRDGCET